MFRASCYPKLKRYAHQHDARADRFLEKLRMIMINKKSNSAKERTVKVIKKGTWSLWATNYERNKRVPKRWTTRCRNGIISVFTVIEHHWQRHQIIKPSQNCPFWNTPAAYIVIKTCKPGNETRSFLDCGDYSVPSSRNKRQRANEEEYNASLSKFERARKGDPQSSHHGSQNPGQQAPVHLKHFIRHWVMIIWSCSDRFQGFEKFKWESSLLLSSFIYVNLQNSLEAASHARILKFSLTRYLHSSLIKRFRYVN